MHAESIGKYNNYYFCNIILLDLERMSNNKD